jgi:hypothetical protein
MEWFYFSFFKERIIKSLPLRYVLQHRLAAGYESLWKKCLDPIFKGQTVQEGFIPGLRRPELQRTGSLKSRTTGLKPGYTATAGLKHFKIQIYRILKYIYITPSPGFPVICIRTQTHYYVINYFFLTNALHCFSVFCPYICFDTFCAIIRGVVEVSKSSMHPVHFHSI